MIGVVRSAACMRGRTTTCVVSALCAARNAGMRQQTAGVHNGSEAALRSSGMEEAGVRDVDGTTDSPLDAAKGKRVYEIVNREWFTLSLPTARGLTRGGFRPSVRHPQKPDASAKIGVG